MEFGKEDNRKYPGQEAAARFFPDILLTPETCLWHEINLKSVASAVSLRQIPPDDKRKDLSLDEIRNPVRDGTFALRSS